ncbi:seminal metalloprotease 1 isoform X2 [Bicyclus anynana]|uniref:Metalloendopeptidase n=1 Tax=Bicyclus anynana TaxID=110368 RepID=A0ABM3LDV6_BICAN|nr:seminal metalloprotease 1 isoform X2 [Bicyclus anynana]
MKWPSYIVICHVCVFKCLAMSLSELEDFSNFLRQTSQLDQNVKSNIPSDEFDEDEPILDNAWETSGKFEGDLILNERQRRMILTNVAEGLARNGLTDSTKRWPNNEVVYFIQPDHFNSAQIEAIQTGIADLARVSCVKFRPYVKGDKDAVVIQGSRRGCFSQVGYQGGYQVLNLSRRHPVGRGCFRRGTVVHELLHTLGFYHMQSSPDRDDYIDVLWDNIIKPARHNFRKYNTLVVSDFGVGYDYDSVLHYSRKAFSSNGQDTLIPKKLGAEIGQRIGLSEKDVLKLNKMYCDADSNLLFEDSSETPKKSLTMKAAESKPFIGIGLGYQQVKRRKNCRRRLFKSMELKKK